MANEKKKVTLSLPVETIKKLDEISKKYGMTKSGLVNHLINQVNEKELFTKKKKRPVARTLEKNLVSSNLISKVIISYGK